MNYLEDESLRDAIAAVVPLAQVLERLGQAAQDAVAVLEDISLLAVLNNLQVAKEASPSPGRKARNIHAFGLLPDEI